MSEVIYGWLFWSLMGSCAAIFAWILISVPFMFLLSGEFMQKYFRKPHFNQGEIAVLSTFPTIFIRTVMFVRLLASPSSGKGGHGMPELTAKQSNSVLSYRDQQAYRLIEQVALWEGRITTNTLQDAFGCSRATASPIIQSYLYACPENLTYCTKSRGYLPTEQFAPRYSTGTLEEYTQLRYPGVSEFPAYPMRILQRRPDTDPLMCLKIRHVHLYSH